MPWSVSLGVWVILGAPPTTTTPLIADFHRQEPSADEAAIAEAQAAFEEGSAAFATSEYVAAVEAFQRAYKVSLKIVDPQFRDEVYRAILFNLGRAQLEAYRIDEDVSRLRKGRDLLERYHEAAVDDAERARAEKYIAEIDVELAPLEEEASEAPAEPPEDPTPEPTPAPAPIDVTGHPGRGLRIGGFALIGTGAAALGLMGGGMAIAAGAEKDFTSAPNGAGRDDAESKGRTGNAMAVAGAVSAGALVTAGVVLVVLGTKKKRDATAAVVTPWATASAGGCTVGGRF